MATEPEIGLNENMSYRQRFSAKVIIKIEALSPYKKQLIDALNTHHWTLIQVDTADEWWIDEVWEIESSRWEKGLKLFILFEVDPLFEGIRKKGQGVWLIDALSDFPIDRLKKENSIASLSMTKRKFNVKLVEFISSLNNYRESVVEK